MQFCGDPVRGFGEGSAGDLLNLRAQKPAFEVSDPQIHAIRDQRDQQLTMRRKRRPRLQDEQGVRGAQVSVPFAEPGIRIFPEAGSMLAAQKLSRDL